MLKTYLSTKVEVHLTTYLGGVVIARLQIHQFGDGSLYGAVSATHYSGILQMVPGIVQSHLYGALHTLADVNHGHATIGSLAK